MDPVCVAHAAGFRLPMYDPVSPAFIRMMLAVK